ncbi:MULTISPECIES: hypothetical protein [unclassified Streptomyces]|uniref:hypothetical protein n=1 Tax=unclassified Streptomyces TaxID=2593676 RepID=UPI002E290E3B|nr:hypothetical protein [Streptomyces sp. NBC_00223]
MFTCFRGPPPRSTPQAGTIQALAGALTHTWVPTGELTPGAAARYNLTADQLHTYYVLAGDTPVLVHNCDSLVDYANSVRNEPGTNSIPYESPSGAKYYGRNKHGQQADGDLAEALEEAGHHGGCAEVSCLIQAQKAEGSDAIRGGTMRMVKSRNNSMPTSNTTGHGEPATPCGRCERLLDNLGIGY